MNTNDILTKLIAEIERWRDKAKEKYFESTYSMGRCDALAEFRNYIVSLQQEEPSLPSNLDEAAKRIAYDVCKQLPNGEEKDGIVYYAILAAIAGAEWMAGQGVNADFEVCKLANRAWLTPIDEKKFMQDIFDNFKAGDKVVVQIRKK